MAKRVPETEKPYRPVEASLVRSVLSSRNSDAEKESSETEAERGPSTPPFVEEKMEREKRMLLTPSEEKEIDQLVTRLASELGTSVKLSHMLRACTTLLLNCQNDLLRHAQNAPRLVRPANGNLSRIAEFDRALARIVTAAISDAPPLD